MPDAGALVLHATSVAIAGRGLLIRGASGSGKSATALELLALGATLIADDRTVIQIRNERPVLGCPTAIQGRIEARGMGILRAPYTTNVPLTAVLDMEQDEIERLPPVRWTEILGHRVALLHKPMTAHVTAAVFHYLRHGRAE